MLYLLIVAYELLYYIFIYILIPRIPRTVYRYFWAYPFFIFYFTFPPLFSF